MATEYKGIDYGRGITNKNLDTNIRYGVIHHSEIGQAWYEDAEPYYKPTCPFCGNELKKGFDAKRCPACYKRIDPDRDFDNLDPISFFFEDSEYCAEQTFDDPDIFILKSPYYTYSQFCSPCAPGAGYLMNELTTKDPNNKTYCFGHEWFESGKAPYTVYRVSDDSEVYPEVSNQDYDSTPFGISL